MSTATPGPRQHLAFGTLLGLFFGLAVVARHRLGDDWGSVVVWLPLLPAAGVALWERRLPCGRSRARHVLWAGLALTVVSVVAGSALLRSQAPASVVWEALVAVVVAVPLAVAGLLLGSD